MVVPACSISLNNYINSKNTNNSYLYLALFPVSLCHLLPLPGNVSISTSFLSYESYQKAFVILLGSKNSVINHLIHFLRTDTFVTLLSKTDSVTNAFAYVTFPDPWLRAVVGRPQFLGDFNLLQPYSKLGTGSPRLTLLWRMLGHAIVQCMNGYF